MIYSISGLLRQVAPTYCVVEACGVGYQCSASTHTLSSLPGRGQEVTLLTHLWVKEDGMELFGFSTEQERRCFRMLIGVSGVGPRVALAILSDSAPDRLMLSIAAGDAKALTRAQSTDVYFREASRQELLAYIRGGEPMDKAGAYGVQGQGALLVERIDGDFFNVMGLPVVLLSRMLAEFGVTLLA